MSTYNCKGRGLSNQEGHGCIHWRNNCADILKIKVNLVKDERGLGKEISRIKEDHMKRN